MRTGMFLSASFRQGAARADERKRLAAAQLRVLHRRMSHVAEAQPQPPATHRNQTLPLQGALPTDLTGMDPDRDERSKSATRLIVAPQPRPGATALLTPNAAPPEQGPTSITSRPEPVTMITQAPPPEEQETFHWPEAVTALNPASALKRREEIISKAAPGSHEPKAAPSPSHADPSKEPRTSHRSGSATLPSHAAHSKKQRTARGAGPITSPGHAAAPKKQGAAQRPEPITSPCHIAIPQEEQESARRPEPITSPCHVVTPHDEQKTARRPRSVTSPCHIATPNEPRTPRRAESITSPSQAATPNEPRTRRRAEPVTSPRAIVRQEPETTTRRPEPVASPPDQKAPRMERRARRPGRSESVTQLISGPTPSETGSRAWVTPTSDHEPPDTVHPGAQTLIVSSRASAREITSKIVRSTGRRVTKRTSSLRQPTGPKGRSKNHRATSKSR